MRNAYEHKREFLSAIDKDYLYNLMLGKVPEVKTILLLPRILGIIYKLLRLFSHLHRAEPETYLSELDLEMARSEWKR